MRFPLVRRARLDAATERMSFIEGHLALRGQRIVGKDKTILGLKAEIETLKDELWQWRRGDLTPQVQVQVARHAKSTPTGSTPQR